MESLLESLAEYANDETVTTSFLLRLINNAIEEIISIMYPNGIDDDVKYEKVKNKVIKIYHFKILYIAEYHFDKQGKEGMILYSENDTSAHFESSGTPASYLKGIIPIAQFV